MGLCLGRFVPHKSFIPCFSHYFDSHLCWSCYITAGISVPILGSGHANAHLSPAGQFIDSRKPKLKVCLTRAATKTTSLCPYAHSARFHIHVALSPQPAAAGSRMNNMSVRVCASWASHSPRTSTERQEWLCCACCPKRSKHD